MTTQARLERSEVPAGLKWNLQHLFGTDEAWWDLHRRSVAALDRVALSRASIQASGSALADALEQQWQIKADVAKLTAYATLVLAENVRDGRRREMAGQAQQLLGRYREQVAFIDTALVTLDGATLDAFARAEPRLAPFVMVIANLRRRAPHILGEHEEWIMAGATTLLAQAVIGGYHTLLDRDLRYPAMRRVSGERVRIDRAGYMALRASPHRVERRRASLGYSRALGTVARTCAALFEAGVRKADFAARARRYDSALALIADAAGLPLDVYGHLVDGVRRGLPSLHRYLRLRRRLLRLPTLHEYDLAAPLPDVGERVYSIDDARQLVTAALLPLGPRYHAVVTRAFADTWLDLMPHAGKQPGAFTNAGGYEAHPYAMLNYGGTLTDLCTLAREVGRIVHRFLASRAQPYPASTPDFLPSETSALVAEQLLFRHLYAGATGAERTGLLVDRLERTRLLLFQQTQLAEFERRIHTVSAQGRPLTAETLDAEYLTLAREYLGHDSGACIVDDAVAGAWCGLPQLHATFAMFQYALAYAAAFTVAERVSTGWAPAPFVACLEAGNSRSSFDVIDGIGLGLLSADAASAVIARMDDELGELEALMSATPARAGHESLSMAGAVC